MEAVISVKTSGSLAPRPLIVSLSRRFGGVDVRVLQTALELTRRGIPHAVAVLAGSELHQRMEAAGLAVRALDRRRADPRLVLDLVRIAKDSGANLVDGHNMQSQYAAALAARLGGLPGRVATVHSLYDQESPERRRILLREGALHLCRASGFHFIAVSSEVRSYLESRLGLTDQQLTLSWNGIEPLPLPPPPIDLKAETGWSGDILVLGMISRIEPVKGHGVLLMALRDLVMAGETRLRLFIAGEGLQAARIRQLVEDYRLQPYVHFAGFRTDVTAILPALDLFCLPSLSEGLPFAVLEACRQGVPVLASRLPSAADLFTDGETIFFEPIGDHLALRNRLAAILSDRDCLQKIGRNAKAYAERSLMVAPMVDTTLKAYARVIARACPT